MNVKPYHTQRSKKEEVRTMFDHIAPHYDFLNHVLSFNIDRLWRRHVVNEVLRGCPRRVLDVATGTGDLAFELVRRMPGAEVTGVDLSAGMLDAARCKAAARGLKERVAFVQGDAERLDFGDAAFDAATVAFGVRNFGDLDVGLRELARTIKPGGRVVILEFSRPRNRWFRALYEWYAFRVLPFVGGAVSRDRQAYAYLPASVGEFPAPAEFVRRLERAGFVGCRARSQSFGIAQIYVGQRSE